MGTRKGRGSRFWCIFASTLSILLIVLALPVSVLADEEPSSPSEQNQVEVTRAQWIHDLVETFDIKAEEENWPEEYFTDIEVESPYYHDYLLALEFGIIDTPAGGKLRPDDAATREFAAHTLNYCLGFEAKGDDYSFSDFENCEFPDDDQIAIDRGWFQTVEGEFKPSLEITVGERETAFADVANTIEAATIDPEHVDEVSFADGVKVLPDGTDIKQIDDDEYTVTDCPVALLEGDTFVAYFYGIPNSLVVDEVTTSGSETTLRTHRADSENAYRSVDSEGSTVLDLSDVEITASGQAEPTRTTKMMLKGSPTKEETPQYSNELGVSISPDNRSVTVKGTLVKGGSDSAKASVDVSAAFSNLTLNHKISDGETYISLSGNVSLSVKARGSYTHVVPLVEFRIMGVGKIAVELDMGISGNASANMGASFEAGVQRDSSGNTRSIQNFTKSTPTITGSASLSADLKLSGGLDVIIASASVYAKLGVHADVDVKSYAEGKPKTCVSTTAYLAASIGAEAKIGFNYGWNPFSVSVSHDIWNKNNSPVRLYLHNEDGKLVMPCSRGDHSGYITDPNSNAANVFGGGMASGSEDAMTSLPEIGASSGSYSTEAWDFTVTSASTARIDKYKGAALTVSIPSSLCGYRVNEIGNNLFSNRSVTSAVFPCSVELIGSTCFSGLNNAKVLGPVVSLTGPCHISGCNLDAEGSLIASQITAESSTICVKKDYSGILSLINTDANIIGDCAGAVTLDSSTMTIDSSFTKGSLTLTGDSCCIHVAGAARLDSVNVLGQNSEIEFCQSLFLEDYSATNRFEGSGSVTIADYLKVNGAMQICGYTVTVQGDCTCLHGFCAESAVCRLGLLNADYLELGGASLVESFDDIKTDLRAMGEGDVVRVHGDFLAHGLGAYSVGGQGNLYSIDTGTVELYGDLLLWSNYNGYGYHNNPCDFKTVFCGIGHQSVEGNVKDYYLGNVVLTNHDVSFNDHIYITLLEDTVIECEDLPTSIPYYLQGIYLNGHSFSINKDLSLGFIDLETGSVASVYGNLKVDSIYGAGLVSVNGTLRPHHSFSMTLSRARVEANALYAHGLTIQSAGSLHVKGEAIIYGEVSSNTRGCALKLYADAKLLVDGDLSAYYGYTDKSSLLRICGNLTAGTDRTSTNSPHGRIELSKNLTINKQGFTNGYEAEFVFCGDTQQVVHAYDSSRVSLNNVLFVNPDVVFDRSFSLSGGKAELMLGLAADAVLTPTSDITLYTLEVNGHLFSTEGSLIVRDRINNMKGGCIKVAGDLRVPSIYGPGSVEIGGDGKNIRQIKNELRMTASSLNGNNLILTTGSSIRVLGDMNASIEAMDEDTSIHIEGNLKGSLFSNVFGGVLEAEGDVSWYCSGDPGTRLLVLCGDGQQSVRTSTLACNVVNAHEDESEVTGLSCSGTYIHDPAYQTGDRYMQLATIPDAEYTAEAASPEVRYGSLALEEGKDYDVVLDTGDGKTAVGTYNLEVVGRSPYKGSKVIAYRIVQANISKATFSGYEDVTYDGEYHTPEITVQMDNRTLERDADYTVSYSYNKSVGTARVYVYGRGSYTGSKTLEFKINPTEEGQRVIDLIAALNVDYLSGEEGIAAARAEYDALAQVDKESVTNYSRLTSGETNMKSLHDAVDAASQAIEEAEALLAGATISADGADVDEGKSWLTQAQADSLNSRIANARTYVDGGGTLYYVRNATSNLTSTVGTTRSALEAQLGTRHVPAEPVEENRVEPTCTEAGSCDLVTYCSVCGEELAREGKVLEALGHDYHAEVVAPTWDEPGYTRHACSRCDDTYDDEPIESLKVQGALAVEQTISALPATEELTLEDAEAVVAARAAFNALTEEQQGMVANAQMLVLAEARLADLAAAKEVDDLIAALPAPADITLMDQQAVEAARAAYEALSDAQKGHVGNLSTLEDAEQAIADLVSQLQLVGNCVWEVTEGGELHIAPIPGRVSGALPDAWMGPDGQWLWSQLMGSDLIQAVTSVRIAEGVGAGTSLAGFLGDGSAEHGFPNLQTVDFSGLDTTSVEDVSGLFMGCGVLQSIVGVDSLVSARVSDAADVFAGCSSLEAVDISSWDTSGIADAMGVEGLFDGCDALTEVRLGQGVEVQRLGIVLPIATWTNGSLYVEGDGLGTLAPEQVATSWRRHTPVDISTACEFMPIPAQEHTGSPVTPIPVMLYEGKVVDDPDGTYGFYTLDYQNNVEVGEATVTVTGRGFFCGEQTLTFRILAEEDFDVVSMVEELQRAVDVARRERDEAQKALEEATTSGEGVEDARRALDDADAKLTEAQDALSQATDLSNATIGELPAYGYSGVAVEPQPTVNVHGVMLRPGTDFVLSYESNVDAGTAKVAVEGKGLFTGKNETAFEITAKPLADVAVATVPDETYTGTAIEPVLMLTDGDIRLTAGTDYEVAYENNTDAGDAVAHVSGTGNYTGTVDVPFRILKATIATTVTLADWSWAAEPNEPVVEGNTEDAPVVFEYRLAGAGDEDYAPAVPTEPGQYVLRATVAEGTNHLGASCTCDFQITWLGVTFNANRGEGVMAPQSFEHEPTQALTPNSFAREGMRFAGWNTRADGTGDAYEDGATLTLDQSMTLYAQWAEALRSVSFMANGKLQHRVETSGITAADFPSDPAPLYGFEFVGWDKTATEINAGIASGDVTVTAKFKARQQSITVTIYNGESEVPQTMSLAESQWIKVTADEVSGKNFAYWTMGGAILSYSKTAQFRTATNCTVTAVYTTDAVSVQGTAVMRTVTYDAAAKELASVAYLTVPDGAIISKAGLVAASASSTTFDASKELTLDNADFKKASTKAAGKSASVTYTWTKSNVAPGDTWYVRPYVSYKLAGETKTVYGDRIDVTAGNDYDQSERATAIIRSSGYDSVTKDAQFVAYIALPEGGSITKAGLVASPATGFDPTSAVLTLDNATYKKESAKAVGKSGPLTYTWTKSNVEAGDTWYARAYVTYTLEGNERTLYGMLTSLTAAG